MNYCDFVNALPADTSNPNKLYHDQHYGFPIHNDHELFGRLILEINQAGLSWTTILKKQAAFRAAYAQFDIVRIAAFDEQDYQRLLADTGIVRNRLKIRAVIDNAQQVLRLQQEYGSFQAWLAAHHPLTLAQWVSLFKQHFKFVGGEIVNEFLMSIGYLSGAHHADCPIYAQVLQQQPQWAKTC